MNNETEKKPAGGTLIAWISFVFGSLVSIAGNVLAAQIPPPGAAPEWQPSTAAQIGAIVWPVGLLLAVEVLTRVRWPAGLLWLLARYGGVLGVALGSALISYTHIRAVLLSWGYDGVSAGVGPLVLDGLMVVSGFALLANATPRTAVVPVHVEQTTPSIPSFEGMSRGEGLDPTPTRTPDPQVTASSLIDETRGPDPVPDRVPRTDPDLDPVPARPVDPVPTRPALVWVADPAQASLDLLATPTRVGVAGTDPDPVPDPQLDSKHVEIATRVLAEFINEGQAKPGRDRFAARLRKHGWSGRNPAAGALLKHVQETRERELVSA